MLDRAVSVAASFFLHYSLVFFHVLWEMGGRGGEAERRIAATVRLRASYTCNALVRALPCFVFFKRCQSLNGGDECYILLIFTLVYACNVRTSARVSLPT